MPDSTGMPMMKLAERMSVPQDTGALLFDMDGVLLDTLGQDYEIVDRLLKEIIHATASVSPAVIREHFPHDLPEFWRRVIDASGAGEVTSDVFDLLVRRHEEIRRGSAPSIHEGINEILDAARDGGLRVAVVSNNPAADVKQLLSNSHLIERVDVVVGNDRPGLEKKPAPDCYLEAARLLSVPLSQCVAIEDSLLGAEAGSSAGCFTIGVATGACSYEQLKKSRFVSRCYESFAS